MLGCSVPEAALVKPGSSNMTHDPWSISARLRETSCLSVFTRISVPARTVLWLPVILNSLPFRTSAMGPCGAGRAAGAGRGAGAGRAAGAAPAAGRFPPIVERKANRAIRVSILTVPASSPLLSERFRRPDIARAHGGVPGRLDLAGVVSDDAVVLAVVEHDVGIGDAGHRTVQVVDGQGPVAHATPVVVIESGIDSRKIHRLGIDEFRTADGASG